MLAMTGACERCGAALPPESDAAMVCSFECTFCAACASGPLAGRCPNCGGELVRRPRRPGRPAVSDSRDSAAREGSHATEA